MRRGGDSLLETLTLRGRNICILLGAGVSCAAGLPSVKQLSDAVAASITDDLTPLFQTIRVLSAKAHGEGRDSYEDWYFVADQVWQHLDSNFENPGLLPLIRTMYIAVNEPDNQLVANLARALCDAITAAVCRRLVGNELDAG